MKSSLYHVPFVVQRKIAHDCFFLSFTHLSVCRSRDTAATVEKAVVITSSSSYSYQIIISMSTFKPRISLDVLPRDSLAIKDDQFYNLVESLTSTDISRILRSQHIITQSILFFFVKMFSNQSFSLQPPLMLFVRRSVSNWIRTGTTHK